MILTFKYISGCQQTQHLCSNIAENYRRNFELKYKIHWQFSVILLYEILIFQINHFLKFPLKSNIYIKHTWNIKEKVWFGQHFVRFRGWPSDSLLQNEVKVGPFMKKLHILFQYVIYCIIRNHISILIDDNYIKFYAITLRCIYSHEQYLWYSMHNYHDETSFTIRQT